MRQAKATTVSRLSAAPGRTSPGSGSALRPDPRHANPIEVIQRTWAETLGIAAIGPDESFFECGGNSLLGMTALTALGERFDLDLPMRDLFEAPTPREMAELISERRAEQNAGPIDGITPFLPAWVVRLQREGAGRPVFLFPGGLGGKWILYRDAQVAAHVGRDRPFYGFRRDEHHLDRGEPGWVAATAADYVAQMRTLQGRGPFLLYGVCSGSALAWEAARQLLALGESIAGMLFYEAPLSADFATVESRQRPPGTAGALRVPHYVPEPLPVDLTMLMTEGWQARGRSSGWEQVVRGRLETVVMPGDTPGAHNLYIHREKLIAGHLRQWIDQSEARLQG
ncbi:MAG: phosphopantetheine-binding protein [Thermomicrobiales bacterium]